MEEAMGKITDSELEVMRVLWREAEPVTITRLRETLQREKGWEPTTIKTLVQRLVNKGAVAQEKRKVFYYRPVISELEYSRWAAGSLVRRLFGGSAKALVASLMSADELTREDVDELRAMFNGEERP